MDPTFYITTPIYYPSGEPHLGHVYTTTCADAVARYHRLAGTETFFLTGTDEHGTKMVQTAEKRGVTPGELADSFAEQFQSAFAELKISNDDFIRTTQPRHKQAVQKIVEQFVANGDLYLGAYEGWYDEGEENFVTETEAKANEFKSPVSGRPLKRFSEPSYFFKLSKYAPAVLDYIEKNPGFVRPESRRNEVLSKLRQGVSDLSVSRSSLKWGIELPNDPAHVLYVWVDALSNYITALGYGSDDDGKFKQFWPADVHLIGKEILWFHTVYWPAMLMSLGLPMPKCVYAHGWWTVNAAKMSKSLGNFVGLEDLRKITDAYGLDALRYYLLRAAPFGSDLTWGEDDFSKAYQELSNVLGNCLNRVVKMVGKYRDGVLPEAKEAGEADALLLGPTRDLPGRVAAAYENLELQEAVTAPLELARAANGYIEATEPFKLAKDPAKADRLDAVLHHAAQAVYAALVGLLPAMPEKAAAGLAQLGVESGGRSLDDLFKNPPRPGQQLGEGTPLFPRIETDK